MAGRSLPATSTIWYNRTFKLSTLLASVQWFSISSWNRRQLWPLGPSWLLGQMMPPGRCETHNIHSTSHRANLGDRLVTNAAAEQYLSTAQANPLVSAAAALVFEDPRFQARLSSEAALRSIDNPSAYESDIFGLVTSLLNLDPANERPIATSYFDVLFSIDNWDFPDAKMLTTVVITGAIQTTSIGPQSSPASPTSAPSSIPSTLATSRSRPSSPTETTLAPTSTVDPSASASAAPTADSTVLASNGLSKTAQIALGVGLGLGLIWLVAMGWYAYRRWGVKRPDPVALAVDWPQTAQRDRRRRTRTTARTRTGGEGDAQWPPSRWS